MDHSGCGFITAYEFSMLMKAASLSGGEKVDFRAHKELAKSRGVNKSSPEQPPARSFRGQPKPLASVSPTRGGRPTDLRGEIAAAKKSSRKAQAKLATSGSAPALPKSPPRRRSLVSLSSVGNARPTDGKPKLKPSASEPTRKPAGVSPAAAAAAAPVAPQLAPLLEALARSAAQVIALYRAWDDDGTGHISRREFRRGLREMRFDAPPELVDALFDSWDPRGSGMLEIAQLERLLHRGAELQGLEAPVAPQQQAAQPAPPPGPRRALPAFMQSRDAPGQLGSSSSLPALPSAQGLHEGRVPREPPSLILPSAFDTSVFDATAGPLQLPGT